MAEQGGGRLGIEDGHWQAFVIVQEYLEVLACRMQDLEDAAVIQDVEQRTQVAQFQGVDAGRHLAVTDLNQAEPGIIGLLADELGIKRQPFTAFELFAQSYQVVRCVDE